MEKTYYYELAYEARRRDAKCVVVKTDLNIRMFDILEGFMEALVERNMLTKEEADNVTWIGEIDKRTYEDMKEDFKSDILSI